MKDRKTRRIIILIAFVLAIVVLIATRPPLRSLIFWAEEHKSLWALQSEDNNRYDLIGPDALLPSKQITTVILSHPSVYVYRELMPGLTYGALTDPAEVASLLQTLRDGAVQQTERLQYEEQMDLQLTLVAADGECWPLTLVQEGNRSKPDSVGYALQLPFPDYSYFRISDECAQAILELFERHPLRDFADPATYDAVLVEDLSSGEWLELDEAQIMELMEALLAAEPQMKTNHNSKTMPLQPDYAIRIRFTDGGEHYLGYGFTAGLCRLFPVRQRYEYDWEDRTYQLLAPDLFAGAVQIPPGDWVYSVSLMDDTLISILQQFFPEVEP